MTTKTELLKIIRKQCITCCGGSYAEVVACQGGKGTNEYTTCHLHPFRFGTDPFNEISEGRRAQGKMLALRRREKQTIPASVC
jgi:hypothetical protein